MVRKRDDESRHHAVPGAEAGDLVPGAEAGDSVPGAEAGDSVPGAEAGDSVPGSSTSDERADRQRAMAVVNEPCGQRLFDSM